MDSLAAAPARPAPAGRRARRRAQTRARILNAALGLFARQGYMETKVEQITEAADVGKGTFFNYFQTKEHVLAGFSEMQLAKVQAAVGQAKGTPTRAVLKELIQSLAELPGRSQALVRSLLVANLSSDSARERLQGNLGRGKKMLAVLMARGQQQGEVRLDRKPLELARLFFQTLFGTLLLWSLQAPSRLGSRLDDSFETFWSGIRARPNEKSKRTSKEAMP